ncbi:hypothetical protein [Azomonas macrocytogenes]|uniref:Uncharacterized protein n=1 Tax=Azomonas macrocytogenes TaxID=69962 RepID=A0A839T4D5_AZOMA|nr:hypothetical protein [Azomonas macrocytogenes]MBB3103194.1 hypothetical protein [Azomonas macrocytogenes]
MFFFLCLRNLVSGIVYGPNANARTAMMGLRFFTNAGFDQHIRLKVDPFAEFA